MVRSLVLLASLAAVAAAQSGPAAEVMGQFSAKVVIPMHYGTGALDAGTKVVQEGHTLTLTAGKLPAGRTVMVMKVG